MNRRVIVAGIGFCLASGLVWAQDKPSQPPAGNTIPAVKVVPVNASGPQEKPAVTLKVGDAAPALAIDKWVKGDAVKGFEKGKVYVVEFWATWCGPCIKAIPHLTELQKEHKDVTFVGVAASERGEIGEQLKKVQDFVAKQGEKMEYRVGFDGDGEMREGWMRAAGQRGIPCTFIVNGEGKIAWIGHPNNLDEALAPLVKKGETSEKSEKSEKSGGQ